MAKQVTGQAKFQVPGGQATPAPPVGTSLGRFGINLGQFVQQFNDRTKEFNGMPLPDKHYLPLHSLPVPICSHLQPAAGAATLLNNHLAAAAP